MALVAGEVEERLDETVGHRTAPAIEDSDAVVDERTEERFDVFLGLDIPGERVPAAPETTVEPAQGVLVPSLASKAGCIGSMHRSPMSTSEPWRWRGWAYC